MNEIDPSTVAPVPQLKHREYSVFISYRHADNKEPGRQWATWLHQTLETYEVPPDLVGTKNTRGHTIPSGLYPVFRDEEELPADAELSDPINNALRNSRHLIAICSPAAVQSRFVNDEIQTFKKLGKADRVLAVIVRGEPNAADDPAKCAAGFTAADECFPEALRRKVNDQGEITDQVTEPIAADFRPFHAQEGWTTPQGYQDYLEQVERLPKNEVKIRVAKYTQQCALMKLKIIAGVLGVPLGELTRRDQAYQLERARKRQKIVVGVAAALAVLLCLAVVGGVFALVKQGEAQSALKERTRSAFEASYLNALTFEQHDDLEGIVKSLEPYLKLPELNDHEKRDPADQLYQRALHFIQMNNDAMTKLNTRALAIQIHVGQGAILDLVLIPAGSFTMGSPEGEKERLPGEKQHPVTISKAFYMGKFTVTQAQYSAVMDHNPSSFKGSKNPVELVSWDEATAFCDKLNVKFKTIKPKGMSFQLPTEAQWEYACRAGTATRFYAGDHDDDLGDAAWYSDNSDGTTHPVGGKKPNAFGLYDMHGNVWQWCQDAYRMDNEKLNATDPINNAQGDQRVFRGGSWSANPWFCRSAIRYFRAPGIRDYMVGFRVVVAPSSKTSP